MKRCSSPEDDGKHDLSKLESCGRDEWCHVELLDCKRAQEPTLAQQLSTKWVQTVKSIGSAFAASGVESSDCAGCKPASLERLFDLIILLSIFLQERETETICSR